MAYSMNGYHGCTHRCVYGYARKTNEFRGYSSRLDFEKQISVKKDALKLLEAHLKIKNWKGKTIVRSGKTNRYHSTEHKFEITKQCLEVF